MATTGVPMLEHDVPPRIDPAAATVTAVLAFRENLGPQATEHGRAADAEVAGDDADPARPGDAAPTLPVRSGAPFPAFGG